MLVQMKFLNAGVPSENPVMAV